jgi:hypothetical protein
MPQALQALPALSSGQGALSAALKEAQQVIDECRTKRLKGELPTFTASVQCSNPRIIQAFNAAHYRYMDLIQVLATKRLEVAQRVDRNELTEDQAKLENAKLYMEIVAAERQRNSTP